MPLSVGMLCHRGQTLHPAAPRKHMRLHDRPRVIDSVAADKLKTDLGLMLAVQKPVLRVVFEQIEHRFRMNPGELGKNQTSLAQAQSETMQTLPRGPY